MAPTMKTPVLTPAKPTRPKALKLKPVDGLTFIDSGVGGAPHPDAMKKLHAFWEKHPHRTLRKGEKGVVELVREARESRGRR